VNIVDPLKITDEFSNILATPVIATDVGAKIVVCHDLYIRADSSQESTLSIPVGNVTGNTELTYEFGVRRNFNFSSSPQNGIQENKDTTSPLVINGKLHLPFQLQIKYTDPDGSRCMRVTTTAKPVTADKKAADRDVDMRVLGTRFAQNTGRLLRSRRFDEAMRFSNTCALDLRARRLR